MSVVNTVATTIADEALKKPWQNQDRGAKAVFSVSGLTAVAAADNDGSTYRLVRLPGMARVTSIKVFTDGIAGGTSYDFGLYDAGSTVKDADCYASAVDLSSPLAGSEVAFEARLLTNHRKKVFEDATDSADTGLGYDLVATANTVGTGNGNILAIVFYVID